MANPKHEEQFRKGVEYWNKWRNENSVAQPDLSKFFKIGAYLSGVHLSEANLGGADLRAADLSGADLSGANLSAAYLNGANLNGANLRGANLSEASLVETNLRGTNLSEARLCGIRLSGATLANIDLRTTKGLATIKHRGPSLIELFSVQLPEDGSALHFLRGVGVPDEWIDDYRIRMMHPIQYYSCFISYASINETLAKRLHADLQAEGVRCWFAPEDMKIGDKIHQRIDEAIHVQDKLLLLFSQEALASDWVETEVLTALEKERRQGREVLFPIRLDESVMQTTQPWARQLRLKRHIGDFTQWADPQAYMAAFKRLLRDLKQ